MQVVVIGGGVSGLAAAYAIVSTRPDVDVVVLEASSRAGGVQRTEQTQDGYLLEHGADSMITDKPWGLDLARRLGLSDQVQGTSTHHRGSYVVSGGRLERVPDGFSLLAPTNIRAFLQSPVFTPRGKARALLDLVLPRGGQTDESLAAFVERRFGREVLEKLAQPMAGGVYGADPARLSVRATIPRFLDAERDYGSVIRGLRARARASQSEHAGGARYGLFVSFRGGMQTLPDALRDALGARVRTGMQVKELIPRAGIGFDVRTDSELLKADAVVLALPAPAAASLLSPLDEGVANELRAIEFGSVAAVNMAYRVADIPHPLDAFGFVVPVVEKRNCVACTWASVKYDGRAPKGHALLRLFVGGYHSPELVERDDSELVRIAREELRALMGIAVAPAFSRVTRYVRAMPQYHVGHLTRVQAIEDRMVNFPSIALAGNSLYGVGVPDAIHRGESAAQEVLSYLDARSGIS